MPQRGERFGLRPDDAAVLRDVSTAAAEAIRRAGYDVTGDLAELVPPEAQPVHPHPDDVTEAELLDVACRAMEQMIRDVRLLNLEMERADRCVGRSRLIRTHGCHRCTSWCASIPMRGRRIPTPCYRSGRNAARISSLNSCGSSQAAKWPPLAAVLK